MEEENLFPKLDLKQFFMHPRKQSFEILSDSSIEKSKTQRNDSIDDSIGKNNWQRLLINKDEREMVRTDSNGNLKNSSLLGNSQEHKFQAIKIENKSGFVRTETNNFFQHANIISETYKPFRQFVPEISVAPVLANMDFDFDCNNEFVLDFEQFKHKIDHKNILPPKQTFKEMNRLCIFEDAIEFVEKHKDLINNEREEMNAVLSTKVKRFNPRQKHHCIGKYISKKQKRKSAAYIRYKIRQDLAGQRVRNKGKFVRNERVDLKKLAEEFMKGFLTRAKPTRLGYQLDEHQLRLPITLHF